MTAALLAAASGDGAAFHNGLTVWLLALALAWLGVALYAFTRR